jgi:hypothetical protein
VVTVMTYPGVLGRLSLSSSSSATSSPSSAISFSRASSDSARMKLTRRPLSLLATLLVTLPPPSLSFRLGPPLEASGSPVHINCHEGKGLCCYSLSQALERCSSLGGAPQSSSPGKQLGGSSEEEGSYLGQGKREDGLTTTHPPVVFQGVLLWRRKDERPRPRQKARGLSDPGLIGEVLDLRLI